MIVSLAQTVVTELGSAMSTALVGLIDGTKTAQEAFADMFKNIGKAFIDMATQIIAKQLVMIALQSLLKALGGGTGIKGVNTMTPASVSDYMPGGSSFAGGGYTGNGPRYGGIDGQGGFPAILHPQETVIDHASSSSGSRQEAMAMYSMSNRESDPGGSMSSTINYTGPTLNFNGDDYIPRSEAPQLVAAGAKQGEQRALNRLRQSRSTRSKLGM